MPEADSNQQSVCCGCDNEQIHMEQRSSVEKKGLHSLSWTGFYYFSGPITSRMVLIYYALFFTAYAFPKMEFEETNYASWSMW